MSSAYHPQTDGQTEVLNRVIEQYLRAFVHQNPSSWGKLLIWAEWSYNTSQHSGSGVSPFEVTYGRKPPNWLQYFTGSSKMEAVDTLLSDRECGFIALRKKLHKAQEIMKLTADKKRREVQFHVGDMVMVRLRPRRQVTITGQHQRSPKLNK